jgi:hypothetical protein
VTQWQAKAPENVTDQQVYQQKQHLESLQQQQTQLTRDRPRAWIDWKCCQILGRRDNPLNLIAMRPEDYRASRENLQTINTELEHLERAIPQQAEKLQHTRDQAQVRRQWEQQPDNQTMAQIARTLNEPSVQTHLVNIDRTLAGLERAQTVAQSLGRPPEHMDQIVGSVPVYLKGQGLSQDVQELIAKDAGEYSVQQAQQLAQQQVAQASQRDSGGIELELG